ncbi:MBG domain-containing protein [Furfurilactobacillus rossiae]|nr:MBG domain-containing protein [Furfurilactobacillus rossiae]
MTLVSVSPNTAASVSAVNSLQALSLVKPSEFVKGTQTQYDENGTLIVNLPAGASADDVQQVKQALTNAHIQKIEINLKDAATDDYVTGQNDALSVFAQAFWSGAGSGTGQAFSDWTGTALDAPDFSQQLAELKAADTSSAQQTINDQVQAIITSWANQIVAKIDWNSLSNSTAYKSGMGPLSVNTSDGQRGYADVMKSFVKGSITAEAYYLWLVKSTDNTSNSLYYGTQGYNDAGTDSAGTAHTHFNQLITTLNSFSTNTATDSNLVKAYDGGHAMALVWLTGDDSEASKLQDAFGTNTSDSTPGVSDNGGYGVDKSHAVLLNEIGQAAGDYTLQRINSTLPTLGKGVSSVSFVTFDTVKTAFMNADNFPSSAYGNVPASFNNLTKLEQSLATTTLRAYYDEWENIVNTAFKQATTDALKGSALALNYATTPVAKNITYSSDYNATQQKIYRYAYRYAKAYLSGYEAKTDGDFPTSHFGNGNTPLGSTNAGTTDGVWSPLDLAIYSVLTGKPYSYSIAANGINTENGGKQDAVVGSDFQSEGYSATNADWIATAAQNDMYQLALNVANQAKTDFLSDIQLAINNKDLTKLESATAFLPSATNHGALSGSQYIYYSQHSYVYYKVFSALYNSYFTNTDGTPNNIIENAIKDADAYVIKSGDSHNGHPVAQSLADAEKATPSLVAKVNDNNITLNGDVTYTAPYSETTDSTGKTTPVSGVTTVTPAAETTIKSSDLSAANTANAQQVIQNAINYAYVHEESVAIPAYEAGYAAVQKHLNVTPATADQAVVDTPNSTYQFENKSSVTDTITPVLTTTNPDGSTVWTANYSNADGTTTVVTINRAANSTDPKLGAIATMELVVRGTSNPSGSDSGAVVPATVTLDSGASVSGVQVKYDSLQLNSNIALDTANPKYTDVTIADNGDGTLGYTFVRDAQSEVTTKSTGTKVTTDGTETGNVYQAGWNYRKSFVSEITLKQQTADTDYRNAKGNTDNSLTNQQIYAGFFENNDQNGNPIANDNATSSLEIDPVTDADGVVDKTTNVKTAYGQFKQEKITNLDGSYVNVTLNTDGSVNYQVYDTKGKESAKNAEGTLAANDYSPIIVTNQDAGPNDLNSSYVKITRSLNDAITVHEIGVQAKMINNLDVVNNGTTATATVSMGANVEPSMTSTTIVTPVSALHQGVLFTKDTVDPKFGGIGINSVYDNKKDAQGNPLPNTKGLTYQGTVNGASVDSTTTPSTPAYYGEPENTTTTIQYLATNASNSKTGTTATIDVTGSTPKVVITLGTMTDPVSGKTVVKSSSEFDPAKTADSNSGTSVFDWLKSDGTLSVTNLPTGWAYDDGTKTLTYTPTTDADKAALIKAITDTKDGKYSINWSNSSNHTGPALIDQYNDVMNIQVDATLKSQATIPQTIDTSDSKQVNADHQYTFTNAAIVGATKSSDPNGLVTDYIEKWAKSDGTDSKTYTGAINGMPLPKGVSAVTLKANGDVVVTFDPEAATSNYNAQTKKNDIKLVLPFTVDSTGKYVPASADTTDPMAGLTLDMTMQADVKVSYKPAAGGANTTVTQNGQSTNVDYAATTADLQTPNTQTGMALGSEYSATVPATIAADKTANFDGATYKLINGTATNDPTGVNIDNATVEFGTNDKTYLYAKTVGVIQGVTPNKPTVTVNKTATVADGVTETIDLSKEASDYDWNTVTFTPDANTSTKYDVKAVVNKAAKTVTVTFTPKTRADDLDFMADAYQDGLPLNGWLTDQKTVTGSTTPVLNNALYVETKAEPALENYTKAATIDVSKSGSGYDATAHTYTFDVPASALSTQELTLLAQGQTLVLTNNSSMTDVKKGYSLYSSDNWGSVKSMAISLNADGTAHVVATLDTSSTPDSSLQNGAILIAGASTDSPADSGIYLALTLTNDLTQDSTGLPANVTKPTYTDIDGKALKSTDSLTSKAVAGYAITSVTFNGTPVPSSELTNNADGTTTYSATHGWGSNSGVTTADKLVWNYAPAKVAATIGTQSKFYGMADPTTPYTVTGLSSWLKAPKTGWQADDFTRSYAKTNTAKDPLKDPVGDYTVTLSDQGIKDLQAANPDYTITDAAGKSTVDKIVAGKLTIKPAPIKSTTKNATRVYNGKSVADDNTNSDGTAYVPTYFFNPTDSTKSTTVPADLKLTDPQDYSYFLADGTTPIAASDAKNVGTYVWKLSATGKKALYQRLGNADGENLDLDFLLSDDSLDSGEYTITADPLDVSVNDGSRAYNGNDIGTDDSSADKKDFTKITFKNKKGDLTQIPDSISLDPKTDFTYKNAKGEVIPYSSVKDAGTYTWTVNDAGKAAIAAHFGEVKDANGKVTQQADFSIDDSQLTGSYTITPVAITIGAPTLEKTYDGNAYTGTDDVAKITGQPANGTALKYTMTDISNDKNVGTYTISIMATGSDNPDYTITVTAGSLKIDPRTSTTTPPSTPTNPGNPNKPSGNQPQTPNAPQRPSATPNHSEQTPTQTAVPTIPAKTESRSQTPTPSFSTETKFTHTSVTTEVTPAQTSALTKVAPGQAATLSVPRVTMTINTRRTTVPFIAQTVRELAAPIVAAHKTIRRAPSKENALPNTGEQNSNVTLIIGISLFTNCLIFAAVRKLRRERN